MSIANCTGHAIPYRVGSGSIIKVFEARGGAWTADDVARNDCQGVAFIVPRDLMPLPELNKARVACDQYYGVPVFDEDTGLLTAIEWSDGRVMPVAEMVEFGGWPPKEVRARYGMPDARPWRIDVVVTRHAPLVALLRERGIIREDTPVLEHATAEAITGKHVLGVLPHWLSCLCASITEVPMNGLTQADREAMTRGDLGLDRTREVAGEAVTYVVHRI